MLGVFLSVPAPLYNSLRYNLRQCLGALGRLFLLVFVILKRYWFAEVIIELVGDLLALELTLLASSRLGSLRGFGQARLSRTVGRALLSKLL